MTQEQFLQKNLAVLRTINADQANAIQAAAPQFIERMYPVRRYEGGWAEVYVPNTRDGSTHRLFYTRNPAAELTEWAESLKLQQNKVHAVLLLGMGLGFHPQAVLERLPQNGAMALIEPDALLFLTAFVHIDLSRLLSDPRVHLYVGQTLEKTVECIGSEMHWSRFIVLPHQAVATPLLRQSRPDYPTRFAQLWRDTLQREIMYRNSRIEHGLESARNTIGNIEAILRRPGVNQLFERFAGQPAALVSPGPSLEGNLDALRAASDRLLIACVNTAYPILRRAGIEPDAVFTMDHHERNVKSFDEPAPAEKTMLIADPRISPRIIKHFDPNVFLSAWRTNLETIGSPAPIGEIPTPERSGNEIYGWLQGLAGEKGDVHGPGSVAVAGFHILARMGCQPIVLVGQDLAFTQDKAYASGAIFDDKNLPRDDAVSHWVESVDGGKVGTSDTLYLYKRLLEHEIMRFGVPVYNASSGAAIAGAPAAPLPRLVEALEGSPVAANRAMHDIASQFTPVTNRKVLREALRDASIQLRRFAEEAREGLTKLPEEVKPNESVADKKRRTEELEAAISGCTRNHPLAMRLLNELLQEAHFDRDDTRWRMIALPETEAAEAYLRACGRVLNAFVAQASQLEDLFAQTIELLES
ncbi:MAG: DUF115 domain-containing protein [bacterium]|nr:DUF115 domain-containing protein [bacterium]